MFRPVGCSLELAFERAEEAQCLEQERAAGESHNRALEAFENLSRDLSLETDPSVLVRRAQDIVLNWLPTGVATYYELDGSVLRLKV